MSVEVTYQDTERPVESILLIDATGDKLKIDRRGEDNVRFQYRDSSGGETAYCDLQLTDQDPAQLHVAIGKAIKHGWVPR